MLEVPQNTAFTTRQTSEQNALTTS